MEKGSALSLHLKYLAIVLTVVLVTGCGGSSGDANTNAVVVSSGQFKDANTSGLNYISGEQEGITNTLGTYSCEEGKLVSFAVGQVQLGSANCQSFISPVDLVTGGSSSNNRVLNIIRFLLMLDFNNNPDDGIQISSVVQLEAKGWPQVNFSVADITTEVGALISDVAAVDGRTPVLPNASTAQLHIEETLRCAYSGAFVGSYSGSDNGNFGMVVNAADGQVLGVAYSVDDDDFDVISGIETIDYNQTAAFVSGVTGFGSTFSGAFDTVNSISGDWENGVEGGSFSGQRVGGASSAIYRFTGYFIGDDYGVFSFDVDSSNNIIGNGYSVIADLAVTGTGNVTGTTFIADTNSGSTITGTLNTATGALSGSWTNTVLNLSGSLVGSGCKIN